MPCTRARSRSPRRWTWLLTDHGPSHDHGSGGGGGHDAAHAPAPSLADSAGQPWKGRHFESHAGADAGADVADDGTAPPELIAAIGRFRAGEAAASEVVDALRTVRLLVPLVAHAGDEGLTDAGLRVDKTQELSLVTVAGPDGRTVLPAFTSVDALTTWNRTARPIPVASRRAALAAASEGTELIVLDPGSPTEFALRRPAVWAVAQDLPWAPPVHDSDVTDAFELSIANEQSIGGLRLVEGDPDARLNAPELVVVLALEPGLDQAALQALLGRLQNRWAEHPVIAERVDSLSVRLTSLS